MELNHDKLQTLIERAWALHDRLNNEIDNSISFCRHCSDHGRFCDIGQTPYEERKSLIPIRDSLKDVENTLFHFKKLQAWQLRDKHSVLCRLEQSRLFLTKQVTQYKGRPLDVVKELNACFANVDDKTSIDSDVEGTVKKNEGRNTRRGLSGFLFCWLRVLFNPRKWQNAVGIAVKLILISAMLSYTVQFYHPKQQSCRNSQRKLIVSVMYSKEKEAEKLDSVLTISKMPLDVSCGRG
ncbi:uncharacterized protein LOC120188675 [Hibiscus syriacus]|uniref:uncharacterized protein LOC120188675 n=1 Tax=Hibiscus syriacus TaxID=106335 RepID=UPI0019213CA7|nr:uncharacterized protein LOC120188675 [Hibiscus syriacus]